MTNSTKTNKKQLNDHDIFVKGILSVTELAHQLLAYYLPETLKKYIDFSTLKLLSDTHIDKRLRTIYSDTIHECFLRKEILPENIQLIADLPSFRFCFLWEYKSSKPHEPIEFQIEDYRKSIVKSDIKNKRPPSIVLPILIYHGKSKWAKKMLFEQMVSYLPEEIMAYVPFPKYFIIDLQSITDDEIEQITDLGILRAIFISLKHGHEKEFFRQHAQKVLSFVDELSSKYLFEEVLRMILEYMQRRSKLAEEEFNEVIKIIEPDMATNIKTIFEVAEERVMEKAMEKAIIAFLRTTKFTDAQIASELDVKLDFVKSIRLKFESITAVKTKKQ